MTVKTACRAALILACGVGLSALGGCSTQPTAPLPSTPSVYQSQSIVGARLDKQAAVAMVSELRRGQGLGPVTLDPALNALAEEQATAMARADKLSHEVKGSFKQRIAASGYRNGGMWENIGAGHDTLADAFTGWRSSPPHLRNMLQPKAARMGIAAVRAPGSRYQVFWALELADPNDPRPMASAAPEITPAQATALGNVFPPSEIARIGRF